MASMPTLRAKCCGRLSSAAIYRFQRGFSLCATRRAWWLPRSASPGIKNNIARRGGIRSGVYRPVFQLIRGGRELMLQQRALLPTLAAIEELHLLPEGDADIGEYLFCVVWKTCCKASTTSRRKPCRRMNFNRARLAHWGWALPTGIHSSSRLAEQMANAAARVFTELDRRR